MSNKELSPSEHLNAVMTGFNKGFKNIKKQEDKRAKKQSKEIEKLKKDYEILEEICVWSTWTGFAHRPNLVIGHLKKMFDAAVEKYNKNEIEISRPFLYCDLPQMKWRHFILRPEKTPCFRWGNIQFHN